MTTPEAHTAPDFEALAEVLLLVHDEPEGLTPSALRKLRDARRSAIGVLISSPSAYRELPGEVLARDVSRLHSELMKADVAIVAPDLARQAAKREAAHPAAALTMLDLGAISHAADVLRELVEDAEGADDERAELPEAHAVWVDESPATYVVEPDELPGTDVSRVDEAERHDAHAVEDSELDDNPGAACYHAFIDLNPQRGEVFTDVTGHAFVVAEGDTGSHLLSLRSGSRYHFWAVTTIGPLTRARIVPADAIVLERPTEEAVPTEEDEPATLTVTVNDGRVNILATESYGGKENTFLTPAWARTYAALIALAADDAERGQE